MSIVTSSENAESLAAKLEAHNRWRRGDDEPAPDPKLLGITIDESAAMLRALAAERDKLLVDNANLRTVMIAAAEEIDKHWQAHCDAEGYGPSSLIRRLEEGIPSRYGYTAGAFERLKKELETVKADLFALRHVLVGDGGSSAIERVAVLVAERAEADRIISRLQRELLVARAWATPEPVWPAFPAPR